MSEHTPWQDRQINTELARAFTSIVEAGWANKSDGNVEATTGFFALVNIEPAELDELVAAVGEVIYLPTIYPGSFILEIDSDGNKTLIEYLTLQRAEAAYRQAAREFAIWDATCPRCGQTGPHGRMVPPRGNTFVCSCGKTWDPTEGI